MPTTLATDTATEFGSVAFQRGAEIEIVRFDEKNEHGARLAELVSARGVGALQNTIISIGPGSFTGLRIGVSFLKGLRRPEISDALAISTLHLWAETARAEGRVLPGARVVPVLLARTGVVYAAGFQITDDGRTRPDAALPEGAYAVADLRARLAGQSTQYLGPPRLAPLFESDDYTEQVRASAEHLLTLGRPDAKADADNGAGAGTRVPLGRLEPAYRMLSPVRAALAGEDPI